MALDWSQLRILSETSHLFQEILFPSFASCHEHVHVDGAKLCP
jgi:hypothetical protein